MKLPPVISHDEFAAAYKAKHEKVASKEPEKQVSQAPKQVIQQEPVRQPVIRKKK